MSKFNVVLEDNQCKVQIRKISCRCMSCGSYDLIVEDKIDGKKRSYEVYTFDNEDSMKDDLSFVIEMLCEEIERLKSEKTES